MRPPARPNSRRVALIAEPAAQARLAALLGGAVTIVAEQRATIVLFDVSDAAALAQLLAARFDLSTIVLLDSPDADRAGAAFRAGASAVLARHADSVEILAAIDAVGAGLVVVDAAARDAFAMQPAALAAPAAEPLSERERDVLRLLARGLSNKRIAVRLDISEHTVKFHVGSILAKLGAATRAEAVARGARLGEVVL